MANFKLIKKAIIISFSVFTLSGLRLSVAQQPESCLAVITEIKGTVFLRKVNNSEFSKVTWGTQLFQSDQIKTSENSQVTLLFANSSLIKLDANSTMTISVNQSPAPINNGKTQATVSASMIGNIFELTSKKEKKEEKGALAGLRSADVDQTIRAEFPYNTLIKTDRPDFAWNALKSFDGYIVNLYNSKGLVWSKKVKDNKMKFPENVNSLMFGETYFWNVEGEDLIDLVKSPNFKFTLLTAERSREVAEQETAIMNTFKDETEGSSLHSFLGAFYISQGLLQDAINEFQIISKINVDAPLPHEILGSIYSDTGNKDKAIEELQTALALAKNKDN